MSQNRISVVLAQLKHQHVEKQLAFAYTTCERLYPNYACFSKQQQLGNASELSRLISFIGASIFERNADVNKVNSLIDLAFHLAPEPANYTTILASSAVDACGVVSETLNLILDSNTDHLEAISTLAIDTVDMYIQEVLDLDFINNPQFQNIIDNHELMRKEVNMQLGILNYLISIDKLNEANISELLDLQGRNIGSLPVCLD